MASPNAPTPGQNQFIGFAQGVRVTRDYAFCANVVEGTGEGIEIANTVVYNGDHCVSSQCAFG